MSKPVEKENSDLYVSVVSSEDCNWPVYKLKLKKGEPVKVNKAIIEQCIEHVGNFNLMVEMGIIKIGD
jgi:hypothetical protein